MTATVGCEIAVGLTNHPCKAKGIGTNGQHLDILSQVAVLTPHAGGIEKDAMPWMNRYIGNPSLSFIARVLFDSKIKDFHCGLRGYNREKILGLALSTTGMEYASEMIVKAEIAGLKITEVPTTLKKDGRSSAPHLRPFRDGFRHLHFLVKSKLNSKEVLSSMDR